MKVLISDFDRTFFNYNYKNNIKAVNEFVSKGNIFVIATGRGLDSLKKDLAKDLKYSYLICNDGSMIYDSKENVIHSRKMDLKVIEKVFNLLLDEPSLESPLVDNFNNLKNEVCDGVAVIAKIIDRKEAYKVCSNLNENYDVYCYLSERWINVLSKDIDKAYGVKKLCEYIGYDYKDVYAIGDNVNDIGMCEICNGVAMEVAEKELKNVCQFTVKNVKDLVKKIS